MRQQFKHKKTPQKSIDFDLNINIENFGPITKAKINLKPLTIFIGPNNSGKSNAAMLIHSILSFENQINIFAGQYNLKRNYSKAFHLFNKDLQDVVRKNKDKQSFSIPLSITKKFFSYLTREVLKRDLESVITRNFASPIFELVRAKQKFAKITVSGSNNLNVTIGKNLTVKSDSGLTHRYLFNIDSKNISLNSKKEENDIITTINKFESKDFLNYYITPYLIDLIARNIKHDNIPINSHYFPAARSDILQRHRALSASIVNSAPFTGIEPMQIPKLTGVVSDFISGIIMLSNHHGRFIDLANQLESELFHGQVKLSAHNKYAFPEITYNSQNGGIPLHRTSSSILEIAPISLYLKHIVQPDSLLIIEEPETHLHPESQLIFAKYIVRMIRSGLNVLVTTHSVFLLERLSEFMLASKIEPKKRKKLGYDPKDYLLDNEVSPYVFKKHNNGGHVVSPVPINHEGISQKEFIKINDTLYSNYLKLQQNLSFE